MADTSVSIVGNLTRDPELRFTPSGQAVVEFGIAVQNRVKNGDEWEDGPGQFFDVTAWGTTAENFAESCPKGTRVIVIGRLQFDTWENEAGEKRSKVKIVADHVGPELRWATADVTRAAKGDGAKPASRPKPQGTGSAYDDGMSDPF